MLILDHKCCVPHPSQAASNKLVIVWYLTGGEFVYFTFPSSFYHPIIPLSLKHTHTQRWIEEQHWWSNWILIWWFRRSDTAAILIITPCNVHNKYQITITSSGCRLHKIFYTQTTILPWPSANTKHHPCWLWCSLFAQLMFMLSHS